MSKLRLSLILSFIVFFVASGISQRHALACELISFSNYVEIAPKVFASPAVAIAQYDKLLAVIHAGKSRVNNTFGGMASSPKVIIAATTDDASDFGSNAYGNALLTPLGQCLVFGPKGQNIDVVAHEFTHAEVHFRVGWFNHFLNIPIWFNEGLSLLVDYREPFLVDNIDLSPLEINTVKETGSNFFSGKNVVKNYQAARFAVEKVNKSQLYDNLEKMRIGWNFHKVFAQHN